MKSFKEEYIYPISAKLYELKNDYTNTGDNIKHEIKVFFDKTIFYLFLFLFFYYCKDFILYLLRGFDKLLIN